MIWWSVRYYPAVLVWLFWFEVAERKTATVKDSRRESLAWLRVLELRNERRRARGFRIDR
jgi:hypothetical protein